MAHVTVRKYACVFVMFIYFLLLSSTRMVPVPKSVTARASTKYLTNNVVAAGTQPLVEAWDYPAIQVSTSRVNA